MKIQTGWNIGPECCSSMRDWIDGGYIKITGKEAPSIYFDVDPTIIHFRYCPFCGEKIEVEEIKWSPS